jgi:hypothetical protein
MYTIARPNLRSRSRPWGLMLDVKEEGEGEKENCNVIYNIPHKQRKLSVL